MTKAEAIRQSIRDQGWKASVDERMSYLRDTCMVEMNKQQVSQYLSLERKRQSKETRKYRPKTEKATAATTSESPRHSEAKPAAIPAGQDDVMAVVEFLNSMRSFESRLGRDQLRVLTEFHLNGSAE